MTLTINQTPVQISLEQERTVGDVLTSLQEWARTEQQTIMSLLIDGRAAAATDLTRDLATISQLDLEVVARSDESWARLGVVESYFELVSQALANSDQVLLSELQAEYGGVVPALDQVLVHQSPLSDRQLGALSGPWTTGSALTDVVVALRERLAVVRHELDHPEAVFQQALDRLSTLLPDLPNLASLWQRGQDQQALEAVQNLMDTLGRLQRTAASSRLPAAVQTHWAHFRGEVEPFLLEIEQALAIQDFVLVGDLIEYELAPRLEEVLTRTQGDFVLDPS